MILMITPPTKAKGTPHLTGFCGTIIIWGSLMGGLFGGYQLYAKGIEDRDSAKPVTQILSLKAAWAMALQNNLEIREADADREIANSKTRQAVSDFFPKINLESSVGTNHDKSMIPGDKAALNSPRDYNSYQVNLSLVSPLFSGWHSTSKLKNAKAQQEMADFALASRKSLIRHEVVKQYYLIQLLALKLEAEQKIEEKYNRQLLEMQKRKKAGAATTLELLEIRYALESSKPEQVALESELEAVKLKLVRLIGLDPSQAFVLADKLESTVDLEKNTNYPTFKDAFAATLKTSSQLRNLAAAMEKEKAAIDMEKSSAFPSLALNANAGINSHRADELGSEKSIVLGWSLQMKVPIFSGLSNFSVRKEHEFRLHKIALQQERERRIILETLKQAYRKIELTNKQIDAANIRLALAQQKITKSEILFENGKATLLQVIDSYASQLEAKKSKLQAQYDRVIAFSQIRQIYEG